MAIPTRKYTVDDLMKGTIPADHSHAIRAGAAQRFGQLPGVSRILGPENVETEASGLEYRLDSRENGGLLAKARGGTHDQIKSVQRFLDSAYIVRRMGSGQKL